MSQAAFFAMHLIRYCAVCLLVIFGAITLKANVPGGVIPGGANVTLTDNGTTVTVSNGIVSFLCTKSSATITQINYTYNNSGSTATTQMLNGGTDGGMLYWEYGGFGGNASTYSVVVNPAVGDANHAVGDYAEIDMVSSSSTNGTVDVHFSMLRGSPGFYVTAIWNHRAADAAMGMGETRTNIYAGSIFNWMSVDAQRNKLMEVSTSATTTTVPGAPVECYLWTNGIYQGRYEDKYKYSADFGNQRVWGWSSVGTGGKNLGLWDVLASVEYYNCGPMKRELMSHIGTTILNMFNGDHYAEGVDANFAAGEVWSKVYGPYFVYCNNVATSNTNMYTASQALYSDALAQATAEGTAWPYGWFVNSQYAPPSARGTVSGKIIISDTGNPNATAANLWVGVVKQPVTSLPTYDFQFWMKPYEFWTKTDANGNFTIPAVISGTGYTLYAFGQGAEGEFMSQNQSGGNPPILYNLPATPFSVTVTSGSNTSLGNVTWTPSRVGSTVFEIGYPDRTARKFRHGDDYWVGDIGPSVTSPAQVWTKFLEYPFDFPNGMSYKVGASRWSTDWDFVQPVMTDTAGNYLNTTGTITFTLASAPAAGAQASIFIGLASNFSDATIVTLNGSNLGSTSGVTATPNAEASNGYFQPYSKSDTTIREGINGLYSDERLTFPGTLLKAGTNTLSIQLRQTGGTYFADHLMYDYLRLELQGYVPPAPGSVTAYAGSNAALVTWPVTPGATSYNLLRSTTSGSGYTFVASGIVGPVSGSGSNNATYLDTTATNGTTYYYVVQSADTIGASANSVQSAGVTPAPGAAVSPPATPAGLTATPGSAQVTLNWNTATDTNYYTVLRSTLYNNGGGVYNTLSTITLTNTATGTSYVDSSPNNGSTYAYSIIANNAGGSSAASTAAQAVPLGAAPTTAPTATVTASAGQVVVSWTAVPGATGYVLQQATAAGGPYTYVTSVTELTYTITGLAANTTYYYEVSANNASGATAYSTPASDTTPLAPPTSVTASPGNTQSVVSWSTVTGATSYAVLRATGTAGPFTQAGTSVGLTFTDHGLTNGTPYYYAVASINANGQGANSALATTTPSASLCLAPTNLAATATNGVINLSWTPSAGATSYVVLRAKVNGGTYATISSAVTSSTYSDTGVAGGPTYYYVVEATNASGNSAYSNQASATLTPPPVLALTWTGSNGSSWDFTTVNWASVTGSASVYGDGDSINFDDTAVTGTVNITALVSPADVVFNNSVLNYTVNCSTTGIGGAALVEMNGNAQVMITGTNAYTGGTTISSGTFALGADSSTSAATVESPGLTGGTVPTLGGTGSQVFVISGGQLRYGGVGGGTVRTFITPNAITVDGGSIYDADGLQELTGGLTINAGGANLVTTWSNKNLRIHCVWSGSGDVIIDNWQAAGDTTPGLVLVDTANNPYSGTITINGTSAGFLGGSLEISSSTALINATIIDNNKSAAGLTFTTSTPQIGGLGGTGNISLQSISMTAGGDGDSTTYSGTLSGSGSFTKAGSGLMILSGSNTYTGTTTVTGGILEILGEITATKSLSVSSGAVLYVAGGSMQVNGTITNSGLVKLSGSGTLSSTGAFTNNGVLDLINGIQSLPANFTNNGTVLDASSVVAQQVSMTGSSFTVTIQGYAQHTYQLQSTLSLKSPVTWTNVGAPQVGAGSPLTFTDSGADNTQGFYQILVSP